MRVDHFEIYRDSAGEYRWRFRASNGEIIASAEGYVRLQDCERAVGLLKRSSGAPVEYLPLAAGLNSLGKLMSRGTQPRSLLGSSYRNALTGR